MNTELYNPPTIVSIFVVLELLSDYFSSFASNGIVIVSIFVVLELLSDAGENDGQATGALFQSLLC